MLRFELGGAPRQLTAYTFDGGDGASLVVPFLDQTSGTETYGAGRYLDLEPELDGTYSLDFKLAYHPSCVYDAKFSRPLTPARTSCRSGSRRGSASRRMAQILGDTAGRGLETDAKAFRRIPVIGRAGSGKTPPPSLSARRSAYQ